MDTPPIERRSTDTVRDRTLSFEEQLVQSTEGEEGGANRSEILSRISKMGQSMLPVPAAVTSSTSEPAPVSQVRYMYMYMYVINYSFIRPCLSL